MATLNPYLTFNGNCEEAFNFYKSVLGGEFVNLQRFKDIPSEEPIPDEDAEKIMHIYYRFNGNNVLMGSDSSSFFGETTIGDNISLSLSLDSEEEVKRIFKALSEGGEVFMPLEVTFWNALFASFEDKFGINWMVSYEYK